MFDLPATLDYISEQTGFEKIAYIGHSMGTTEMFYGLAALPDYFNSRLSIFVALAPVGTVSNTLVIPFQFIARYYDFAEAVFDLFKIGPIFTFHEDFALAIKFLCPPPLLQNLCIRAVENLVTIAPEYDDFDRFINYLNYYPNGSSSRCLKHMLKGIRTGRFENYTAEWDDSLKEKIHQY